MKRSLQIKYSTWDKDTNNWLEKGPIGNDDGVVEVLVPSDGGTIDFQIIVDNDNLNGSFFVDVLTGWKNYKVVRKKESIHVFFDIPKNLEPFEKYGAISFNHKNVDITINVSITQKECVYSIECDTQEVPLDPFPYKVDKDDDNKKKCYEKKSIGISAKGGSEKWYVKEILEYNVIGEDSNEVEVPIIYDGAFEYSVVGNELIIKSYGKVDLSKQNVRYYFVIAHKDVNNKNKRYCENYEQKISFYFSKESDSSLFNYKDGFVLNIIKEES